jgi:hypothetical protein
MAHTSLFLVSRSAVLILAKSAASDPARRQIKKDPGAEALSWCIILLLMARFPSQDVIDAWFGPGFQFWAS